jgi:hypothetical protein
VWRVDEDWLENRSAWINRLPDLDKSRSVGGLCPPTPWPGSNTKVSIEAGVLPEGGGFGLSRGLGVWQRRAAPGLEDDLCRNRPRRDQVIVVNKILEIVPFIGAM